MTTLAAVALALILTAEHNGTNGLNPNAIEVTALDPSSPNALNVDLTQSPKFVEWIEGRPERYESAKYLVLCALPRGMTVQYKKTRWEGEYGLATTTTTTFRSLAKESDKRVKFALTEVEAGWVSSCIMAHVNLDDKAEYISLRGNPSSFTGNPLRPTPAERWALSYPEGVFLANLLPHTLSSDEPRPDADLKISYTLSLNLPEDYTPGMEAKWRPLNASIGRRLTFDPQTHVPNSTGQGKHLIATKVGQYLTTVPPVIRTAAFPPGVPALSVTCVDAVPADDPYYKPKMCKVGGERLHPLFVHLPLTTGLAYAVGATADPGVPIQAISDGARLEPGQARTCPDPGCAGKFPPQREGETPKHPQKPDLRKRLVDLNPGQVIAVVLRNPPAETDMPADTRFTALVRYRTSGKEARAEVEVFDAAGAARKLNDPWPATKDDWMQVYPAQVAPGDKLSGGKRSLRIRITGSAAPPELEVAGFVPGPPWCRPDAAEFMGVCTEEDAEKRAPVLRRR